MYLTVDIYRYCFVGVEIDVFVKRKLSVEDKS